MKRFNPHGSLMDDFDPTPRQLPTHRPIIQYIRRSTPGQMTKNIQSLIQQDQALKLRLLKRGWAEDQIIPISVDDGVSGQKLITDREGLAQVYRDIESGRVGAIACYDASRIWRDVTGQYSSEFIAMLQRHLVPLVTFEHVYSPSGDIYNDPEMDLLKKEFEASASYIKHFYNKVIPAKRQAIQLGHSFPGGACPLGYIVMGPRGARRYVPYEPHAKIVRWMFTRFRELGYSTAKLWQEVRRLRIPPFEQGIEKPYLALHFDGQEYRMNSYSSMTGILTNVAYIGMLTYTKTVGKDGLGKAIKETIIISRNAHKPLVSMDDFLPAFNRLSDYTLEGEVNERRKAKHDHRYADVPALLNSILKADGDVVYAKRANRVYASYRATEEGWRTVRLAVPIDLIDGEVRNAIKVLLLALEDRRRRGLEDTLYTALAEMHEEKEERVMSLDKQIVAVEKGIRMAKMALQAALEADYKPGAMEATRQLKRLDTDKQELMLAIERMQHEEAELAESKALISDAIKRWFDMPFEKQYRFMKLLVERANMSELSPHVVRLDLLLSDPLNCTLTGFLFRKRGTKEAWSEKELAIIRDLYPETDRAIIERALPLRSWRNIITQASFMGLRRYTRTNTSDCSDAICYQDAQMMRKAGMHGEKTLWKLTGAHDISTMEADTILRIESVTTPEERNMSISPLPGETNFDVLEREVKKWDVIEARMDKIEYDNDVSVF